MTYCDAGEEIAVQPPAWRNQGRIALGVFDRLDRPVILEGNALYTNLSWHVITRGSPHFDPIYYGRRGYTAPKGRTPPPGAGTSPAMGWFAPHTARTPPTPSRPTRHAAVLSLGGDALIPFQVDCGNSYANKHARDARIIRACDRLAGLPEARGTEPWLSSL